MSEENARVEQVWERIQKGRHTAVVGLSPGEPPATIGLSVIRVSCDVPPSTLGPLLEARRKVESVLDHETPLLDQARQRVVLGLRRRILGDLPARAEESALVELCNRLAQRAPRPYALLFDAVDAADEATLDVLRRILGRPGWLKLPVLLVLREAMAKGAGFALLDALREAHGADAVVSASGLGAREGAAAAAGAEVRAAFEERLRALPPDVLRVLRVGAVVGSGFEADLVAELLGESTLAVIDALQRAADAGMPVEDRGEGRFHLPEPLLVSLRASTLPSLALLLHRRLAALLTGAAAAVESAPETKRAFAMSAAFTAPPMAKAREAQADNATAPLAGSAAPERSEASPSRRDASAGADVDRGPSPSFADEAREASPSFGAASTLEEVKRGSAANAKPPEREDLERAAAAAAAAEMLLGQPEAPTGALEEALAQASAPSREGPSAEVPEADAPAAADIASAFGEAGELAADEDDEEDDEDGEDDEDDEDADQDDDESPESGPRQVSWPDAELFTSEGAAARAGGAPPVDAGANPVEAEASARAAGGGEGGIAIHAFRSSPMTPSSPANQQRREPFAVSAPAAQASSPASGEGKASAPWTPAPSAILQGDDARAAAHLTAAGEIEAAAERYLSATRQAAAMGASAQAFAHGARALRLLEGLPDSRKRRLLRAALLLEFGRLQWQAAGPDSSFTLAGALEVIDRAQAMLKPGDPLDLVTTAASLAASVCYDIGDLEALDRALEELSRASRLLLDAGDAASAARLLNDQAAVYIRMGDPVRATHLLGESRKIFEDRSGKDPVATLEMAETDHLFARIPLHVKARPGREGDALSMGLDHAIAAERAYRSLGMRTELGRVWETMGRLELRKGRLERASSRLTAATELQGHIGDLIGLARSTAALSEVLAASGRYREAVALLGESVTFNFEKGSPIGLAFNRRAFDALAQAAASDGEATRVIAEVSERLGSAEAVLGRMSLPGER